MVIYKASTLENVGQDRSSPIFLSDFVPTGHLFCSFISSMRESRVQGLRQHADDKDFQQKWQEVKQTAKEKAVARIKKLTGVDVRRDALMDVQVWIGSLV